MKPSGAEQIRIGIIGAGLIGKIHSMMLRLISDRSDSSVLVVAIADVDGAAAEVLAARWPGARAVSSAEEVIAASDVDAVFICTPSALHRDSCIAAARAGKHIFCEKPLAMSALDASEMAEVIRASGVISQVGLVLRFSPVYTVIRTMVRERTAGRLLAVTMRDDQDFPIRGVHASGWRNDPALTAGGTLIEHSVHDFDLMRWMFGRVRRIYCRTRNLNGAGGIEDFGATELEFADGAHGQLTSIWHRMIGRPSNRRLEVFTENLFIGCDHDTIGPIVVQRGDTAHEETIPQNEVMARFKVVMREERPYLAALEDQFEVPYALEDATFVAALRGKCAPDPEFTEGVRAQLLVEAAYQSAQAGTPVAVNI